MKAWKISVVLFTQSSDYVNYASEIYSQWAPALWEKKLKWHLRWTYISLYTDFFTRGMMGVRRGTWNCRHWEAERIKEGMKHNLSGLWHSFAARSFPAQALPIPFLKASYGAGMWKISAQDTEFDGPKIRISISLLHLFIWNSFFCFLMCIGPLLSYNLLCDRVSHEGQMGRTNCFWEARILCVQKSIIFLAHNITSSAWKQEKMLAHYSNVTSCNSATY